MGLDLPEGFNYLDEYKIVLAKFQLKFIDENW